MLRSLMRMLTVMDDEQRARRFGDYLLSVDVDNHVEPGPGGWTIWVVDDDTMDRARDELRTFEQNPNHPRYQLAHRPAQAARVQQQHRKQRLAANYIDVRTSWQRMRSQPVPVTIALVALSILVALLTNAMMSDQTPVVAQWLRYSPSPQRLGFDAILSGQVWRLVTPIFVHFGLIHLFFNMMWLAGLGAQIERSRGSWRLAVLVLVSAAVSNTLEHLFELGLDVPGVFRFAPGGFAAGMSGVVYALFGFVWMRGRYAPQQRMGVQREVVMILLIWLVVCMMGWMPIANVAHLSGLIVGMLAGWLPVKLGALRQRGR